MNSCVFCEREFLWIQELAEHLAYHHTRGLDTIKPLSEIGLGLGRTLTNGQLTVNCWCGTGPLLVKSLKSQAHGYFASHLQSRGGLVKHFMEIILGESSHDDKHGPGSPLAGRRQQPL